MQSPKFLALATGLALAMLATTGHPLSAQERTIRIFTFEGYTDDEWVKEFEEANDATVNVTYTGSVDEMFAKMKGSEGADYDLISIDTSCSGAISSRTDHPLRHGQAIPNTANLLPAFQDVAEVQHEGESTACRLPGARSA